MPDPMDWIADQRFADSRGGTLGRNSQSPSHLALELHNRLLDAQTRQAAVHRYEGRVRIAYHQRNNRTGAAPSLHMLQEATSNRERIDDEIRTLNEEVLANNRQERVRNMIRAQEVLSVISPDAWRGRADIEGYRPFRTEVRAGSSNRYMALPTSTTASTATAASLRGNGMIPANTDGGVRTNAAQSQDGTDPQAQHAQISNHMPLQRVQEAAYAHNGSPTLGALERHYERFMETHGPGGELEAMAVYRILYGSSAPVSRRRTQAAGATLLTLAPTLAQEDRLTPTSQDTIFSNETPRRAAFAIAERSRTLRHWPNGERMGGTIVYPPSILDVQGENMIRRNSEDTVGDSIPFSGSFNPGTLSQPSLLRSRPPTQEQPFIPHHRRSTMAGRRINPPVLPFHIAPPGGETAIQFDDYQGNETNTNFVVPMPEASAAKTLDANDGRPDPVKDEDMIIKMECKICFSQVANIALLPCGKS